MINITITHHGTPVNEMKPTAPQRLVIETVAQTVNIMLRYWPAASGKTVVRKMLAQVILDMDYDGAKADISETYKP